MEKNNKFTRLAKALGLNRRVTPTDIREYVIYNPETGQFRWAEKGRWHAGGFSPGYAGKPCGYVRKKEDGYLVIQIRGVPFYAHKLAWFITHGEDSVEMLDHINRITGDNRIANLRQVTRAQNAMNSKVRSDSTSGVKGVSYHPKNKYWEAYIRVNRVKLHLGTFKTVEEARLARAEAEHEHFGEFSSLA